MRSDAAIIGMLLIGALGRPLPAASPAVDAQRFAKHVVVAQEGHAADLGREILRKGGNAVDAAVATAFALAVTLPEAGNLGGGGFLVAYLADRRQVVTVDFREMAPGSASPRMYLGSDGKPRPRYRTGAWAAAVPGTVRGLALAHARWGRRPWSELVQPAARLARQGFAISEDLAGSLNRQLRRTDEGNRRAAARNDFGRLRDYPESVAAFGKPDGTPWRAGDRLVQPDLAATLDRIAAGGADEFYGGRTAQLLAKYATEHGGFLTLEDLKSYQAKIREPVHTSFRGAEVYSIGPPSSGGVVLCLMLEILERFDLKADGRAAPRTLHRVAEAMRRAYFIRATQLADPDFVPVPVGELLSQPQAEKLARSIGDHATPSAALAPFPIQAAEADHTTHLSVLDQAGNAVALTYTLEDSYGAKCVVAGAGFLLNNEMGDFNLIPDRTDTRGGIGTPANRIQPHKRMLSSQTPTLVLKHGRVRAVTGSPGGRTIPNTTLWVVLNLLEFDLDPTAAVAAPRTHHQWFPDTLSLEGRAWPKSTLEALAALGHRVRLVDHQGVANTIVVDPDPDPGPGTGGQAERLGPRPRLHGVPDRRRTTSKASGD
ncbi:MAG TPA: gamma-glutamyltransferase [Isosphaeraceae bacterium]|nr:gamma-glutamyltransferase [Isosphaeraceae bacterium]